MLAPRCGTRKGFPTPAGAVGGKPEGSPLSDGGGDVDLWMPETRLQFLPADGPAKVPSTVDLLEVLCHLRMPEGEEPVLESVRARSLIFSFCDEDGNPRGPAKILLRSRLFLYVRLPTGETPVSSGEWIKRLHSGIG